MTPSSRPEECRVPATASAGDSDAVAIAAGGTPVPDTSDETSAGCRPALPAQPLWREACA
jgi:hypothetical protein